MCPDSTRLSPSFREYEDEELAQRPAGSVGKNGDLVAEFGVDSKGVTRLVHDYARAPFHHMGGLHHDEHLEDLVSLYVQSPTGGIAQGDRGRMQITARENAKAHVTTQSATKVYHMEENFAQLDINVTAEDGAFLEVLPEPTILYENARYHQTVSIDISPGATVLLSDVLVPGRLARGEAFAYDRYRSTVRADCGDDRVFVDTVELDGEREKMQRLGVLGDQSVVGSFYVLAPTADAQELSDQIHNRLSELPYASASTLPGTDGIVVRALGKGTETVTSALNCAWDETRTVLLAVGAHQRRKY